MQPSPSMGKVWRVTFKGTRILQIYRAKLQTYRALLQIHRAILGDHELHGNMRTWFGAESYRQKNEEII